MKDPKHPQHAAARAELDRRSAQPDYKPDVHTEGAMKRMVTTQSNKADRMASTDKKGLETYKKKKIDEISLDMLTKKISNTGLKSTDKAMNKDKVKNDLKAMRARLDKIKPVAEKTLTPAEKKKREEIAQAMHRDNPDMPMGKKMAIATATAKRVAEEQADPDTVRMYKDNPDMMKKGGPGGMKGLNKSAQKDVKAAMKKEEKDTHVTKDGRTVKKGLWYYMNKRKKAGTSRPKSAGTVDPKMMKKSQK